MGQLCTKEEQKFVELLDDNFMFQHVNAPTREGNILDFVISNEIAMVEELKLVELFSTSDHNMVEFQLVLKPGVCDTNTILIEENIMLSREL